MADEFNVGSLERELGVPPRFLDKLLREGDDWSFVIKLHAVFEAALAHILAKELTRPELVEVFAHTEMSRSKTGKVAIAKSLGLLTKRERRFLRSLSELRNQLVYDVTNTNFAFGEHISQLKTNQPAIIKDLHDRAPAA